MGFFDDVTSFVSDTFGNSNTSTGSSWANGLLDIGTSLADTGLSLYSNRKTQQANDAAADRIVAANQQNADAMEAANLAAQSRFEQLSADAQPGVTYLKKLAAGDPYDLTPGQEQYLSDARRDAVNTLSRSGLRGSGRAVTAALKEVDSDLRNNFINSNLSRGDQAAGQLAGMNSSATRAAADYGIDAARSGTGNLGTSADVAGGAGIANQELGNSGLADVSSTISSLVKEGRKSRYFTGNNPDNEVI
ncbi:hypothetical protein [Thalassospira aquimaris]|uniref:Uncharacterized protein n=1 Tax=Thalassospira aquimaris TaxID=3037796 RepID=A0ABT6GGI2_9PROT|nr:hypothetical protein [Thalassospira sp. FZY0004]MDG4721146.1 hypothetical protein [Thalassospira sp. FZY0004]